MKGVILPNYSVLVKKVLMSSKWTFNAIIIIKQRTRNFLHYSKFSEHDDEYGINIITFFFFLDF